jgi:hypothetical protein
MGMTTTRDVDDTSEFTVDPRVQNGFEVLPARGRVVTNELVRQIIEETSDSSLALECTLPRVAGEKSHAEA